MDPSRGPSRGPTEALGQGKVEIQGPSAMDKYVVLRRIGVGSYGAAHLIRLKKDPSKQFVLKKIRVDNVSPKERAAAHQEVKLLSQLNHPFILSYVESFQHFKHLCIVTEYCEMGDMYQRLKKCKKFLPEEQVVEWVVQIGLAIQYIHERQVLHRDLKTQNVFLTKEGTIKLGDFGIARVLNSPEQMAKTVIGTPYYMSPEIMESRPYDYKTDLWSLGCVLYEMTSLKHAFDAQDMNGLVMKILRGKILPVPTHYSAELRALVNKLLSKHPRQRPTMEQALSSPVLRPAVERWMERLKAGGGPRSGGGEGGGGEPGARRSPPPPGGGGRSPPGGVHEARALTEAARERERQRAEAKRRLQEELRKERHQAAQVQANIARIRQRQAAGINPGVRAPGQRRPAPAAEKIYAQAAADREKELGRPPAGPHRGAAAGRRAAPPGAQASPTPGAADRVSLDEALAREEGRLQKIANERQRVRMQAMRLEQERAEERAQRRERADGRRQHGRRSEDEDGGGAAGGYVPSGVGRGGRARGRAASEGEDDEGRRRGGAGWQDRERAMDALEAKKQHRNMDELLSRSPADAAGGGNVSDQLARHRERRRMHGTGSAPGSDAEDNGGGARGGAAEREAAIAAMNPRDRMIARREEENRRREAELLDARRQYFEERKKAEELRVAQYEPSVGNPGAPRPPRGMGSRDASPAPPVRRSPDMAGGGGAGSAERARRVSSRDPSPMREGYDAPYYSSSEEEEEAGGGGSGERLRELEQLQATITMRMGQIESQLAEVDVSAAANNSPSEPSPRGGGGGGAGGGAALVAAGDDAGGSPGERGGGHHADAEEEESSRSEMVSTTTFTQGAMSARVRALRDLCVQNLGAPMFERLYEYMQERNRMVLQDETVADESAFRAELAERIGADRMHYVALVDQLLYCEEVQRAGGGDATGGAGGGGAMNVAEALPGPNYG